jgi:hypothetical protein
LYRTDIQQRTSRQIHTQGNNKNKEGEQHRNITQMENMQCVTTWKKGQKNSSEAESFKHMKIKYPTHLKMAM